MAIFDIEKDDLLRLSDVQLEDLIARLAEAEVAAQGHSPARVSWSGSINAPDGGIDVHVQVPVDELSTGFLERPQTIFQVKTYSMPKSEIASEMLTNGVLSDIVSLLASESGSYVIVSLADDCSPLMRKDRLGAMNDLVKDDPNSNNLHLDFYDRSKLAQWLRQHPSVLLWVKEKLGQGHSGWQPYGAWSNPPQGVQDTLIFAPGVTVTLPLGTGEKLTIEAAINPMRELIRSTNKAVRITGLSGVGKTRIVQALFDETVGINALDRTVAVYVDTGENPNPSATAMLDRLITENRSAVMVLDNCPSELHSSLASKVSASEGKVRLITVEYDIKDDKPQTTEVIHIETVGPEVAEQLLNRRFPAIGQTNAQRIAEFADGNARVSLAIAERVEEGESLAKLSDAQLFNRLFEQRNHPDENLKEHAEILSLVYSFSVLNAEVDQSELEILGSILGASKIQLSRSVNKLLERHIIQKRAHWRAILPHAIANKLAISALNNIPVDQLRGTFEAPGRERLLMSFAHRLGLLHDHPVAKEIVRAWLKSDGLLGRITELDERSAQILDYIGPVVPEALLNKIEAEFAEPDFKGMEPRYDSHWSTILNFLQALAYEPGHFERCVRVLIRLTDFESESNNYDSIRDRISRFFQAYLSGTHASLAQRITIINECLASEFIGRRSLGIRMLSTALSGSPWIGSGISEFGARPRDFGFEPDHKEIVEWYSNFIDVAVRFGTSGVLDVEGLARITLAEHFRGMWHQEAMRETLIKTTHALHAYRPWGEGWKAIRSTIYFDYLNSGVATLPDNLAALERALEPHDLISKIMTYVLSSGHEDLLLDIGSHHENANSYREAEVRLESMALQLGEDFAVSDHELHELGPNLFSDKDWMPNRAVFGKGLARGAHDLPVYWQRLVDRLEEYPDSNKYFAIFAGFIEEVDSSSPSMAQQLLDQCAQHPELRRVLVGLHPRRKFSEVDLNRCMSLIDDAETCTWMYEPILWRDEYTNLPAHRVLDLARRLLDKSGGDDAVLKALSMRLPIKKGSVADVLGDDLRQVGLKAAIQKLGRNDTDKHGSMDHHVERVIDAALRFDGNEAEKLEWLDTIFAVVDKDFGYVQSCESAIKTTAELMTKEFLDRIVDGNEEQQNRRRFFIRYSGLRGSPLAKTDVGTLIEWCSARNDASGWLYVAASVNLWLEGGDSETVKVSESAIRLLEACPEPDAVFRLFADRVRPSSWSGSLSSVMQTRVDAISRFIEHTNVKISEAAKVESANLARSIKHESEREKRQHEEWEQRFE